MCNDLSKKKKFTLEGSVIPIDIFWGHREERWRIWPTET